MYRHLLTLVARRYIDFGEHAMVFGWMCLAKGDEDVCDLRGRNLISPEYKYIISACHLSKTEKRACKREYIRKSHTYVLKAVSVTRTMRPTVWKCAGDVLCSEGRPSETFASGLFSTSAVAVDRKSVG
jgi:hypothetical protein